MVRLKEGYEKTQEKYSKILDRLTWPNACLSGLSVASGILSVATLSTFIGHAVRISLGAVSLAGASVSGMAAALTKKYQKKLAKVTKLTDIVTLALAVFEMSISKMFKDGKIYKQEFNRFQTLHLEAFNDLSNVGHKMAAETRSQF